MGGWYLDSCNMPTVRYHSIIEGVKQDLVWWKPCPTSPRTWFAGDFISMPGRMHLVTVWELIGTTPLRTNR